MAAVWILLSKTSHPAEVIESSLEQGVKTVSLPFDISADYVPDILKPADDEVLKFTQVLPLKHRYKHIERPLRN
jgi:hypothetical protein